MRMRKILTISIAAYNSEKYLVKCLDSLVNCKEHDKLEILVINDGSTDTTRQIAEGYQERYPNSVKVINKENGGHGSTINCSIKLATGKYFKLVDADDWVDSEGLDKLVKCLEQTSVDLVLNPYTTVSPCGEITSTVSCVMAHNLIEYGKEYEIGEVESVLNFQTHFSTFRTEIVKQIRKPITENCFYVDVEYILYLIVYVKTVMFLDYVLYRYLYGTSFQSMNKHNQIKKRDDHLHVIKEIITFYCSLIKDGTTNGMRIIHDRVIRAIKNQYVILFSMKDIKKSRKEAIQFDNYLLEECPDLYSDALISNDKITLLLRFLRKTKFHGYGFMMTVLHSFRYFV